MYQCSLPDSCFSQVVKCSLSATSPSIDPLFCLKFMDNASLLAAGFFSKGY